jgi:predicted dehydrogenase
VFFFKWVGFVLDAGRHTSVLVRLIYLHACDRTPHSRPHWTPLTRQYFAIPASGGGGADQFFYFTSLMAWLLQKAGKRFAAPEQHDDPNASCSTLLQTLKDMGFAAPSFPPAKLKQGWGDAVSVPYFFPPRALEQTPDEFS